MFGVGISCAFVLRAVISELPHVPMPKLLLCAVMGFFSILILYVAPAVNSLQVTALVSSAATMRRSKRLASSHRRLAR